MHAITFGYCPFTSEQRWVRGLCDTLENLVAPYFSCLPVVWVINVVLNYFCTCIASSTKEVTSTPQVLHPETKPCISRQGTAQWSQAAKFQSCRIKTCI